MGTAVSKFLATLIAFGLFIWYIWSPFVRSLEYESLISLVMALTGGLIGILLVGRFGLEFMYIQGYLRKSNGKSEQDH